MHGEVADIPVLGIGRDRRRDVCENVVHVDSPSAELDVADDQLVQCSCIAMVFVVDPELVEGHGETGVDADDALIECSLSRVHDDGELWVEVVVGRAGRWRCCRDSDVLLVMLNSLFVNG